MIPVTMERASAEEEQGDCLMACCASIFERELHEMPGIMLWREDQWMTILADVARRHGFRVLECGNAPELAPVGYAIALGPPAGRGEIEEGLSHACVALDGQVVHDPHPCRTGLAAITAWLMLVPIARTPARLSPTTQQQDEAPAL